MTALRMQFLATALVVVVGIFPTGFDKAHGFLYLPVAMFLFAGLTGICPGMLFWKKDRPDGATEMRARI